MEFICVACNKLFIFNFLPEVFNKVRILPYIETPDYTNRLGDPCFNCKDFTTNSLKDYLRLLARSGRTFK